MFKKDRIHLQDVYTLRDQMLEQIDDHEKELDSMLEKNDNPVTIEYLKGLKRASVISRHELRQTFLKIEMLPQS